MNGNIDIQDIIIIGAGPCGLALAARLRERTPAAIFTDEEHRRFHWIRKHGSRVSLKQVRGGKTKFPRYADLDTYSLTVLDAESDTWMGRWNRLFETFGLSHLRSHMLWHIDPSDRDSLLSFTYRTEREDEIVEMRNCVGKEMSKHARKRALGRGCGCRQDAHVMLNQRETNDYYRPSQALFRSHCDDVTHRYELDDGTICKETLRDLDYGLVQGVSTDGQRLFTVTSDLRVRYARAVVLATGPANEVRLPLYPSIVNFGDLGKMPSACHSMHIKEFPDPLVKGRIRRGHDTHILVIGGGLTSAQLTDLAIRKGVTKVWLIMRGTVRVKHFDVDLNWMGKYKNTEHARFWLSDSDEERLAIIKEARGGGSLNPTYHKVTKKHAASGKLSIHTKTNIVDMKFDEAAENAGWIIKTDPPIADLPRFDFVYFATGINTDFERLPYLQNMLRKFPIPGCGGFPCITEDLMWKKDIPLFFTGRLASLQLGPAAPNLGGAKLGAERVALAIEELAIRDWPQHKPSVGAEAIHRGMDSYALGQDNMYSVLAAA